jgi:thiamine phosphate synthase YjbQ (UPF0047 family)
MQAVRNQQHQRLSSSAPQRPRRLRAAHHPPRATATHSSTAAAADAASTTGRLVDARRRTSNSSAFYSADLELRTLQGISLHDLTPLIKQAVRDSGVCDGIVVVTSKHTTVAVTVNEMEARLVDDARLFLQRLAPSAGPWLHNDLHLRNGPPDWPGGDEAWRAQEPENAQAHIQAMLLGASVAVPVVAGELQVGTWQSVIGVELDGSRTRRWSVAVQGLLMEE